MNDRKLFSRLMLALPLLASMAAYAADSSTLIQRGEYLARAADCIACHTANPKQPYAGGVGFPTPVGIIYSSNISPDRQHGIGALTEAEFISAVREGVAKDGKRLYPAMPYTSYTQMSDDDVKAIRAYLMTVKPMASAPPANTLPFPFNQRWTMRFWNWINFSSGRFKADPSKSVEWNRGAYLAGPLAHCQECHTPRNMTMGLSSKLLAGAQLGEWSAYNITADKVSGVGGWTDAELTAYLRDGAAHGKANAAGPMAEVVENSTRFLTPDDLKALVSYLRTVPERGDGSSKPRYAWGTPVASVVNLRGKPGALSSNGKVADGKELYNGNCASCHGWSGNGIGGASDQSAYPSLLHNTAVGAAGADNLTMVVLHGVSRETNHGHVMMPGFANQLNDQEVAALVNFVSTQFGNPAATVKPEQVAKKR